jgi:biotin carboxylase
MRAIVFIGCNKSGTSRDALTASKEMGFYTILLTERKDFLTKRNEFTEVDEMHYIENLLNREFIFEFLDEIEKQKKEVKAVASFIDPYVSYAAGIAKEIGVVSLSISALRKMEDKAGIREWLKQLPVTPQYFIVHFNKHLDSLVGEYSNYLPLIIKNPVSNGSKDVLLANTTEELMEAFQYFKKKFPQHPVLLEEYLEGTQYLIEVIAYRGGISIIAVIEQEILQSERFIITGYVYPAKLSSVAFEDLENAVETTLVELGFKNGNCHLEMRLVGCEWKLIEINPRMSGGAMNRIILEGTGINLVKEILKLYMGETPSVKQTKNIHVYTKFVTIDARGRLLKVTGKNRALSHDGVKEVYIKPRKGAILTKPYSLGNRYAYVLASADSAETAKKIAFEAAGEIKFYLEPL